MPKINTYTEVTSTAPDDLFLHWNAALGKVRNIKQFNLFGQVVARVDTIADLKALSVASLKDGGVVLVAGYYAVADGGGGAFYYDATSVTPDNGGQAIEPTAGAGCWFRIMGENINAKEFGLKSDDATFQDFNKTAWRNLWAYCATRLRSTVVIPDGDYYINFSFTGGVINIPSGVTILMGKKTRLIVDNNSDPERWIVFRIFGGSDILIDGGEIVGDKVTVLGAGNYGDGIYIASSSSNVTVRNTVVRNCYTDCYYVGSTGSNFRFESVEGIAPRRNCLSVTEGSKIWISNSEFSDASGLGALESGIDIESEGTGQIEDVSITNCIIKNNGTHGIYVHKYGSGALAPRRVSITGCYVEGSEYGIVVSGTIVAPNVYYINDVVIANNTLIENGDDLSDANIIIETASNFFVNNNVISGGHRGIYALRVNRGSISGNSMSGTGDTAIELFDSDALYPNYDIQITGNTIYNTAEYGITAHGASLTIADNVIDGVKKDGIAMNAGQNSKIIGNSVFNCSLATDNTYRGISTAGVGGKVIGNIVHKGRYSQTGLATAGGALSITLSANAPILSNVLNGYYAKIISGTGLANEVREITAYNGTTKVATTTPAWTANPDATTVYEILPMGFIQKHGIIVLGDNVTLDANDIELSGATSNFLDLGVNTRGGRIVQSNDAHSAAGAINVYAPVTKLTTTGADALTLADGIDGQVKTIVMVAHGGDGTLTPATKTGYNTIAFTAVGHTAVLQFFTTYGWVILSVYGSTVA